MKSSILSLVFLLVSVALKCQTFPSTFIEAWKNSKYDSAYLMLGGKITQMVNETQFRQMMATLDAKQGSIVNYSLIKEEQGQYFYNVVTDGPEPFVLHLVTENNKIVGFWIKDAEKEFRDPKYANKESFIEKELEFSNLKYPLKGTLTMPKGKDNVPLILLVHGSGPNDRDETIGGNKVFRDLAWGLASRGIAVVRYDKRTFAFADSVSEDSVTIYDEVVDDAVAILKELVQLPGIDTSRIILAGHSLGAMMAPLVAQRSGEVDRLILLAAPARNFARAVTDQMNYFLENLQVDSADKAWIIRIKAEANRTEAFLEEGKDYPADSLLFQLPPAYYRSLRGYDQLGLAGELNLPVLILQGKRDYQVNLTDYQLWQSRYSNSPNFQFKLYPRANHLFINGKGISSPEEYEKTGNVAEEVIQDISKWILKN